MALHVDLHPVSSKSGIARRITAVVMMQILPAADPHVLETMVNFEQALYVARSRA